MNVLMISTDSQALTGGSSTGQRFVEYASLVDHLTVIVCTRRIDVPCETEIGNLKLIATRSASSVQMVLDALRRGWRLPRPDLITAQDPFEIGFVAWILKLRFHCKLQLQLHTDALSPYFGAESFRNRVRQSIAKFLLPKAEGVRVVSARIARSLEIVSLKAKPVVLPIFVDSDRLQQAPIVTDLHQKYPQFSKIVLMLARLAPEKNHAGVIRLLPELLKAVPSVGLVIVGSGIMEKSLKRLVQELGLSNHVLFEPPTTDTASYYKTADVFVLNSTYEGYALTVTEAAVCGCPIIMTDVGSAGEVIHNRDNALVVPVGDTPALQQALIEVLVTESLQQRLGAASKEIIQALPNRHVYLQRYQEHWQQILSAV